jgi:hypothetical protein
MSALSPESAQRRASADHCESWVRVLNTERYFVTICSCNVCYLSHQSDGDHYLGQNISFLLGGQEELFLPDWSHKLVVHGLHQGRQHLAGTEFCELVGQWSILRGGISARVQVIR